MIREKVRSTVSGWLMVPVLLVAVAGCLVGLVSAAQWIEDASGETQGSMVAIVILCVLGLLFFAVLMFGFFIVNPNEARVLTLFGNYAGSVKTDGFHWANPLLKKRHLASRAQFRKFRSSR